ncbi:helix-turn-helix transcriptional regulator [Providencia stuartii]|uniref:helix-turn-helix domain-containing protein n=1 Tax=Providencia stuartii TaxID=588 RepID=UPI0028BFB7FC|nr:helix-turn-helix transcriptional regulator [Providencia stuartii]MDT7046311.1 helix-turn-helix transcriptional regulator [Providencia stuartii]
MRHLHFIENKATQQSTLLSMLVKHGESMEPTDLFTLLELASELSSDVSGDLIELASTDLIKSEKNQLTEPKTGATQNTFAARLRLALAHSGMTQADLAKQIGVSQSTISALATGRVKGVGIERGAVLSEALGVNLRWLMLGEGEMQPAKNLTQNDEV